MTYRSDSATSPPQGRKAASAPQAAPAAAQAPTAAPMPSGDINHNMHVYHHMDLQQNANIPLPGTYRPAHPAQNGKG